MLPILSKPTKPHGYDIRLLLHEHLDGVCFHEYEMTVL